MDHRALASAEGHFHREPGPDVLVAQLDVLRVGNADARDVILLLDVLVGQDVGGNEHDFAEQFGRRPLVQRRDPQARLLSDVHVVPVGGHDLGLDDQLVVLRHDVHDRLRGGHHAAHGVHLHVDHLAFQGRHDTGAGHLVAHGEQSVAGLEVEVLRFGQVGGKIGAVIVLQLDDPLLRLAHGELGLGDLGDDLTHLSARLRQVQPPLGELILRHELAFGQARQRGHVLLQQLLLLLRGVAARRQPVDLFAELLHPALEDLDFTGVLPSPLLEQVDLRLDDFLDPGVAPEVLEFRRENHFLAAIKLGVEPVDLGQRAIVAGFEQFLLGARLGVVEYQQRVAGGHVVAFAHVQDLDDAPFQVLDGLVLAVHLHQAHGHDALRQRGQRTPEDERAQGHAHHGPADPHRAVLERIDRLVVLDLRRRLQVARQKRQHPGSPVVGRRLHLNVHCVYFTCIGRAGAAGAAGACAGGAARGFAAPNCPSTSSRGPKFTIWPSCITPIWSTRLSRRTLWVISTVVMRFSFRASSTLPSTSCPSLSRLESGSSSTT